jgi:formylglycine-generating enzyme required for sulfatase activity/predicted Ser/Thr protein kinase
MLAPNTILQNRYRVVRELGHGGMGTVYEALDQRVNCIVALKETTAGDNDEARRAFEREASLLGNLRHSSLPKVMDYFSEQDGDFLIMEFIPGHDLAELLELRGSPFPQTQAMLWADELLKVLEYLHRQKPPILHRDIKPSNLKLTKQGEIFLLDFGLAKGSLGQMPTLASSQSVRGYTPVYASLEQIHGQGTDARSDIYSFGATLYHLLTGAAPIDAPTRFHALEDDQTDPLALIQKVNPQVSPAVAAIIHSAMAVSRKHRPASAAEMRKALQKAASEDERGEEAYSTAESRRVEQKDVQGKSTGGAGSSDEQRRVYPGGPQEEEDKAPSKKSGPSSAPVPMLHQPPGTTLQEQGNELPPLERPLPPGVVQTVPSRAPERLITGENSSRLASNEPAESRARSSRRLFLIAAGVFALAVAGVIIVWFVGGPGKKPSSPLSSTEIASSSRPAANQPGATGHPHPAGMVYVPGGSFIMGRDNGDDAERPTHQATVNPFFIDTYEVTNEDYEKFVKGANHRPPAGWKNGSFPAGAERKPVTNVTWDDANDYARWAGKRLPTEEEWEFAARGPEDRLYPWGNDWQDASANANGAGQSMADVGAHNGTSPFGAYDMVGNAWEWTASNFKAYPGRGLPANLPSGDLRVIRGGSFESTKDYATTTYRAGWPARGASTYDQTGFRCAKDLAP